MFKEYLKNDSIPFVIDEAHRLFYYRGLKEYENTKGYLIDLVCLVKMILEKYYKTLRLIH